MLATSALSPANENTVLRIHPSDVQERHTSAHGRAARGITPPQSRFWKLSHRAHAPACRLADRHYSRQKPGAPQFVPPGRCLVLITPEHDAVWVTSWPFAEWVKHRWAGAWVCSIFRNESAHRSSDMIREAVAITRWVWPDTPQLGMVTFVDADKVEPKEIPGWCFIRAGFKTAGYTEGGLRALQLTPNRMRGEPLEPRTRQRSLFESPPPPAHSVTRSETTASRITGGGGT